jgi:hypothetical protein
LSDEDTEASAAHLHGMNTLTAAIATSAIPVPLPLVAASTLGARLAAESRRAQGFEAGVEDRAAVERLRQLCSAPRPRAACRHADSPAS